MPPLINAQSVSKAFGPKPFFRDLSLTIEDRARIGLIGPNGAGKSTLLGILATEIEPDSGEVTLRRRTRLSYVSQVSDFAPGQTVGSVLEAALRRAEVPEDERARRMREASGRAGFDRFAIEAVTLSGGWRKRLAIVEALVTSPDVLLLDEPTNHLDLAGIEWLESLLQNAPFAYAVVSHDRYFLENVAGEIVEINAAYPNGLLRVAGNYSRFLEAKEAFLEAQVRRQESLENRVKTEIEWLRRGPKARATKAKARIDKAHAMIGELADLSARNRVTTASIEFSASNRQSKRLIALENLRYDVGPRTLFRDLNLALTAGMRLGLVGPNGSGKTTLLKLLNGELAPSAGSIQRAPALRIVYFDQNRRLDDTITLRRALAPDSDSVIYQDRVLHVASWASRFLFTGEQLNQPVANLSGGERARVLIARLMLEPADLLLLDEPTNDLDIPTLEILEESLLEFRGSLVLVTHDRYLLDRVSTTVLGLDGQGRAQQFADYRQWEEWVTADRADPAEPAPAKSQPQSAPASSPAKKRLSYLEAREYAAMEDLIVAAEARLSVARARLEDPSIASNAAELQAASAESDEAQSTLDRLYERWADLESKLA